eukprot:TRINITY_DN2441_c0_g1_i2.p1 TRINITY_DN2441_c0_g1~~TRINITY_DN2441_c0_g1_i2.p1  ORF type:complete len:570 (+),score=113.17 TRINITY_DN2441_c0_g1_i2:44-1753(+)
MASTLCRQQLIQEYKEAEMKVPSIYAGVTLVDEDLTKWSIKLRFSPETELQQGLEDYAQRMADPKKNVLQLRLYFPSDYPLSPPEVRIFEPVMVPNPLFTFGGGVVKTILLGHDWSSKLKVVDFITDFKLRLLDSNSRVHDAQHTVRPYPIKPATQEALSIRTSAFPTTNNFEKTVRVLPVTDCPARELSDRISLPTSAMHTLYQPNTKLPLIFELKTQEGRVHHMGISSDQPFMDVIKDDEVVIPKWVLQNLYVPHPSISLNLRCVELKAAERILLQPRSKTFYEDMEACKHLGSTETILNIAMKDSYLTALTVNSTIRIKLPKPDGAVDHSLEVLDTHPPGAVRLISTDTQWEIAFKVEFVPAPDYEDIEDQTAREAAIAKRTMEASVKKEVADQKIAAAQQEMLMTLITMEKLRYEDETPNIGKNGDVNIKINLPNGQTLDGKFKEGSTFANVAAFVILNSTWSEDTYTLLTNIEFRTTMPPKKWSHSDKVTKSDHHRQRLMVSKASPEWVPEEVASMAESSAVAQEEESTSPLTRMGTDKLEDAWTTATEQQKVQIGRASCRERV